MSETSPNPSEQSPLPEASRYPARAGFVHLRVHSALSMSEGAIKIKDLVGLCKKHEMPAVALTDSGNIFGALEFSVSCAEAGIQPIIGCQLAITQQTEASVPAEKQPDPDQLVVLAKDDTGYENLMALVSEAFLETDSGLAPQIALESLEAASEGLILLTGWTGGPVGRLLLEGKPEAAEAMLRRYKESFGDRVYVEIQRHGMEDEERIEGQMLDLAYALDMPLVATNEAFFPGPDMFEAHDVLICMAGKTYQDEPDRRRLTPHHHFKDAAAMERLFADLPEAIENTSIIAQRCAVMAERRNPILPHSPSVKGRSEEEALRQIAAECLEKRLEAQLFTDDMDAEAREAVAKPYRERLEYELGVIVQMGFPGYFLIVADFIQWTKDHGIPVGPGRGSGAGSCVAWALTITDLDPLRFGLLFERFLNPERVSMPDFDIDFCQDRREEVIRYVQKEYGTDRVAQIITFGKLQARAVLRSVGRVLRMPLGFVDKICKMVPNNPAQPVTLKQAIDGEPQLQRLRDEDDTVRTMLDIGMKLEGLYSHASTHAAGVVIGDRPLNKLVALYRDPNSDMPVTQFNMKWVEQAGLVKFDFLGLKTLTVLQRAVELINRDDPGAIDLDRLDLTDRKTFEMLGRGDSAGVFQLESSGMRDVLRNMKPDTLEDIIAVVALYRPGPMDNIPSYIKRKKGEEPVIYMHKDLEPILKETYGIMIYQEQVMQAAQIMAGYSLGGADLLRRAMGKKIKEAMDKEREKFCVGSEKNGTSRAKASEVFDQIAKFAGYGFNKSHAAAYALVAYQTAFLKANYPVAFMAAVMTYDMHNTDKLAASKVELDRLGIPLLPPDVNASDSRFDVQKAPGRPVWGVRYALGALKNVGETAMKALVEERSTNGPFASLEDFVNRMDPRQINKRMLENLIKAGALDGFDTDRGLLLHNVETILRHAQLAAEERSSDQGGLFAAFGDAPGSGAALAGIRLVPQPDGEEWTVSRTLEFEREAMGFYLSAHPLDAYKDNLARVGTIRLADLPGHLRRTTGSATVKLAVLPGARKERNSAKSGNRYAFVELSDASGLGEAMFFQEVLGQSREMLDSGAALLVHAGARLEGEEVKLTAQRVESLDKAIASAATMIRLEVDSPKPVDRIKTVLSADPRGNKKVVITAILEDRKVDLPLPTKYAIRPTTLAALRDIAGITSIEEA